MSFVLIQYVQIEATGIYCKSISHGARCAATAPPYRTPTQQLSFPPACKQAGEGGQSRAGTAPPAGQVRLVYWALGCVGGGGGGGGTLALSRGQPRHQLPVFPRPKTGRL